MSGDCYRDRSGYGKWCISAGRWNFKNLLVRRGSHKLWNAAFERDLYYLLFVRCHGYDGGCDTRLRIFGYANDRFTGRGVWTESALDIYDFSDASLPVYLVYFLSDFMGDYFYGACDLLSDCFKEGKASAGRVSGSIGAGA